MIQDPVIEKIIVARIGLLLKHPFFGNIATRLVIKDASDWCKTAATDGRHIFFNREFFEPLTAREVEFVLCHEILHNVFDHFGRLEGRDRAMFNIATDYCVNGQLVRDKIGDMPKKPKLYHDPKYYGKSAEEIYDILYETAEDEQLESLGNLLDEHIDWAESDNASRPHYTKEELRQIRDEISDAMIQAAQAAGAGSVPASIKRLISDLTEPKMNWRQLLNQQIQSVIKNDYTFMRPNRKGWHLNAILPGTNYADTIDICIALDLSGSIRDPDVRDFLGEVKGIMQSYQDFKIKIWTFDTQVYNEQDFDSYNVELFDQYELIGGGGTSFSCNWEYMKERTIVPKKFIMFTDMESFDGFGDETYCDTIFVAYKSNTVAPHGITVQYDASA